MNTLKNRICRRILCLVLMIMLLPACFCSTASADDTLVTVTLSGTMRYDWAGEVFKIVNQERKKEKAESLTFSRDLTEVAMQRAAEVALYFSHTRPNGTSCFTAPEEAGYPAFACGENIAIGQGSPAAVMNAWMNSPGHRANILSASAQHIGVGCCRSGNVYAWVQMFSIGEDEATVSKKGSQQKTVEILTTVSRLSLGSFSGSDVTIEKGATADLPIITGTNTGWSHANYRIFAYAADVHLKDGTLIATTENGKIKGVEGGTGKLKLYAYKGQKKPSAAVKITVTVPLKILSQPTNVKVREAGNKATVTFGVQGTGLTYQWYVKKPGEKNFRPASTKAKYTSKIKKKNNGETVYCEVRDFKGKVVKTKKVKLSIAVPVYIKKQPASAQGPVGSSVMLTIKAKGDQMTYQWYLRHSSEEAFMPASTEQSIAVTVEETAIEAYCVVTDCYGFTATSQTVTVSPNP